MSFLPLFSPGVDVVIFAILPIFGGKLALFLKSDNFLQKLAKVI
jgi:hypothetical protein